ncbi:uncharacterized protein FIBRA_01007 [Fibroporia radiculosa]|uniref:Urease accessory protein UreD n=1 Tax=Fibroporia radiculosa TaxID=599839 RepID=J4H0V3_9APHY|nr:uncharacterized protein FIBRA_01007 [Fibroporia radiculosa]CCL98999.1 predicted protein [Fibroporia radiculosa]
MDSGVGRIALQRSGSEVSFSELSSTYPLKLLSPRIDQRGVAVVYVLTYGGGLVGGDAIELSVEIRENAALVVLSQGSTKVFKSRIGHMLSTQVSPDAVTSQTMNVLVQYKGALFLLPDPVTCFRSAKYNQVQIFRLEGAASVVILDWVTSGRRSLGEEWAFSRYYSMNEVWVNDECIAKDVTLLEEHASSVPPLSSRTLADALAPYSCYATLILYGPLAQSTIRHLSGEYAEISVFKHSTPPSFLWSLSHIREGKGCVVRVAAKETEDVRSWLGLRLKPLERVIGNDIYRKAFS